MAMHRKLDEGSFLFPVINTETLRDWRTEEPYSYMIIVNLIYVQNRRNRSTGAQLTAGFRHITDSFNIRARGYGTRGDYVAVGLGVRRIQAFRYDEKPTLSDLHKIMLNLREELQKQPEERVMFRNVTAIHWNPFVEKRMMQLETKHKKELLYTNFFDEDLRPIPIYQAMQEYEIKDIWPSQMMA